MAVMLRATPTISNRDSPNHRAWNLSRSGSAPANDCAQQLRQFAVDELETDHAVDS